MKKIILLLILLNYSGLLNAQKIFHSKEFSAYVNYKKGRISGEYRSYYKNEILKSIGHFENGLRNGRWKFFDKNGRLVLERMYTSPWTYKIVFPAIDDSLVSLLRNIQFSTTKNEDGIYMQEKLRSEDAIVRHKIWRDIFIHDNPGIFNNDLLKNTIDEISKKQKDSFYTDYRFTQKIAANSQFRTHTITSFKLYEEFIFDKRSMLGHFRILGIAPVGIDQTTKDTAVLFWAYYPDLRKYLVKKNISENGKIKNLDELFLFRGFSGQIYKTTNDNPYGKPFSEYPGLDRSTLREISLREDIELIEKENNSLIYFNSGNIH